MKIINLLIILTLILNIVFPNSFQLISISILFLINLLIAIKNKRFNLSFLHFKWGVFSLIFCLFILFSSISFQDKIELFFKYAISPFLWINLFVFIFKKYNRKIILNWIIIIFLISNFSVIIFYILSVSGYGNLIKPFMENARVNTNTGLGFTLHIYGSLIFFSIAFIPIFNLMRNYFLKYVLFISLLLVIVISGRTALYLSLFLSIFYFLFNYKYIKISPKAILSGIVLLLLIIILYNFLFLDYFKINLYNYILETHLNKIETGGGTERSIQVNQILSAIKDNPFGNGFITLQKIRDYKKTYNYEVLILSTIMRFGIPIFIIILLSLKDIFKYFNRKFEDNFSDIYILGFIGIIITSFTNPYLESFSFQWMFFAPLVYFNLKKQ